MSFTITYSIKAVDKFSATLKNIEKNFSKLNQKVGQHNRSLQSAGKQINNLGSRYTKVFGNTTTQFAHLHKKLRASSQLTRSSIVDLQNKSMKLEKVALQTGNTFANITEKVKTRPLDVVSRKLQNVGNIALTVGSKLGFLSKMGPAGKILGVAATAAGAVGAMVTASHLKVTEMRLAPLVGGLKKAIVAIDQLRDISIKTGRSFQDTAQAYKLVAEAGFRGEAAMKLVRQSADIAALTGTSTQEIAQMYTRVQTMGTAGIETFQMLSRRGVNLYSMLGRQVFGDKAFKIDPSDPSQQMVMRTLNAYLSAQAVRPMQFNKMLTEWVTQRGAKGEAVRMATTTLVGNLGQLKQTMVDLSRVTGMAALKSSHLIGILQLLNKGLGLIDKIARAPERHDAISKFIREKTKTSMLTPMGFSIAGGLSTTEEAVKLYDKFLGTPEPTQHNVKIEIEAEGMKAKSMYHESSSSFAKELLFDIGFNGDRGMV